MATVRKRTWRSGGKKKEAWIIDYFDTAGVRRQKTYTTTKKEAEAELDKIKGQLNSGTHTPDSASITVAEAAVDWIKRGEADDLERSTLREYSNHIRLHINPDIGGVKLSQLTTPGVEAFKDRLLKKHSQAMARKVMTSLKSILNDALRRGNVAQNVAGVVKFKKTKRHKKKLRAGVDFPTKEELKTLMDKATGRGRPLMVTAIFTGLRSSELRGLAWGNVKLDRGKIAVEQRADRWATIGSPKSGAAHREIPIPPIVVNTLREWRLSCPKGDDNLVFPNTRGGAENHANMYGRLYRPLQVACKITRGTITRKYKDGGATEQPRAKYDFHSLRHAAASLFIEQGFTPKKLQEILGHSTIQLTFDVYGHLFPDDEGDQEAVANMAARLLAS